MSFAPPAPPRPRPPTVAAGAGVVIAGVLIVGLLLGQVVWAVVGLLAGLALLAALVHPRWALLALVVVEVSNASSIVGGVAGVSLGMAALLFATASLGLGVLTGKLRPRYSPVMLLAGVFVVAQLPSLMAAADTGNSWGVLLALIKDLYFLVLVTALALAIADAWVIARIVTAVITALAGLTLVNEFALGSTSAFGGFSTISEATGVGAATERHAGPLPDSNFWGRLLVLAVPLAMSLAVVAWRRSSRAAALGWAGSLLVLLGGVYLTGSRGTLLSVTFLVICWLALAEPMTRRLLVFLPIVALLVLILPGVGSRLASLGQLTGGGGQADYSLAGRAAAQQIYLAMFRDNPGLGVGLGSLAVEWPTYTPHTETAPTRRLAPHNLYLQLGAESGLVGLAGWLVFFVGVLVLAARVWTAYPVTPLGRAPPERLLAVGAAAALLGWGVASLFLHLAYWPHMLVVAAIVAVLYDQTRARQSDALRVTVQSWLAAVLRPAAVARVLLTVVAAGLVLSVALTTESVARVTVTVRGAVGQVGQGDVEGAYTRDVLSRLIVLPTYAAVMDEAASRVTQSARGSDDYRVAVAGSSTEGTLVVEASGPRTARVVRLATAAADTGVTAVNNEPALSGLATAESGGPPVTGTRQTMRTGLLVGGLALLVVANLAPRPLARLAGRLAQRRRGFGGDGTAPTSA